jgi:hypothetical protein
MSRNVMTTILGDPLLPTRMVALNLISVFTKRGVFISKIVRRGQPNLWAGLDKIILVDCT